MTWGIFNKIAKGARDTLHFVKDKGVPVAKKVVSFGKEAIKTISPFLEGTKYGGYADKVKKGLEWSDDVLDYGEDILDAVDHGDMKRTAGLYKNRGQLRPQFD